MSSAINHKKRSRRGYKMQRTHLAPKKTPLISRSAGVKRIKRGLLYNLLKHMTGGYERTSNT